MGIGAFDSTSRLDVEVISLCYRHVKMHVSVSACCCCCCCCCCRCCCCLCMILVRNQLSGLDLVFHYIAGYSLRAGQALLPAINEEFMAYMQPCLHSLLLASCLYIL